MVALSLIATSDLWLFIHASNLLPFNSPPHSPTHAPPVMCLHLYITCDHVPGGREAAINLTDVGGHTPKGGSYGQTLLQVSAPHNPGGLHQLHG